MLPPQVQAYRGEFRKKPFYRHNCGFEKAYNELDGVARGLVALQAECKRYQELAYIFEFPQLVDPIAKVRKHVCTNLCTCLFAWERVRACMHAPLYLCLRVCVRSCLLVCVFACVLVWAGCHRSGVLSSVCPHPASIAPLAQPGVQMSSAHVVRARKPPFRSAHHCMPPCMCNCASLWASSSHFQSHIPPFSEVQLPSQGLCQARGQHTHTHTHTLGVADSVAARALHPAPPNLQHTSPPHCPAPTLQSIAESLEDLTMVKDVWDTSMLCECQFSDWKDTLWSDIRTDVMEDGAKTFVKEVKSLHKKV